MVEASGSSHGDARLRERLELARDGLSVARLMVFRDRQAARREILRARWELQAVLRSLAAHRELAPVLAPLLALSLELGRLEMPGN